MKMKQIGPTGLLDLPMKLVAEISLILQNIDIKPRYIILLFCCSKQCDFMGKTLWKRRYPKNDVQEIINQRAFF